MPAMPCVVLSWINAAHCNWIEVGCSNFLEDCKIFTAAALAYFLTATTFPAVGNFQLHILPWFRQGLRPISHGLQTLLRACQRRFTNTGNSPAGRIIHHVL